MGIMTRFTIKILKKGLAVNEQKFSSAKRK